MKNRRGVSLIEVVVAMVLFALIATVHTVATMQYGLRQRVAAIGSARTTALSTAVDLYSSMPRAEIAGAVGCATISDIPAFPYTRCVTVTAATGSITRVQIIITPTNTALRPDTVWVDRTTRQFTPPFI
jgi:prepilin-type N-terminal cleavage/methylation domain-containing protein